MMIMYWPPLLTLGIRLSGGEGTPRVMIGSEMFFLEAQCRHSMDDK